MANVLDGDARRSLLERVGRLTPESRARWGVMNVDQMLRHLADPMRIALGELRAADVSTFFTRTLLKRLVLIGMPAPKGKVKTFPELDYAAGGGTPPEGFETDRKALLDTLERFVAHAQAGGALAPSPAFGPLSPRAYGRLTYVHMHHHLKQFGV